LKEIALLGPTASGKTALSLELANIANGVILSLDSLSIYKEIDIASAKPTKEERGRIVHFGIDEIYPDEHFSSAAFLTLYQKAKNFASKKGKNLIIVGGTGFYLKSIIDGLSPKPKINAKIKEKIQSYKKDETYKLIVHIDPKYAQKISPNDSYRIEKWLEIYLSTTIVPTKYFEEYQKRGVENDIKIYEIVTDKDGLRKKIAKRSEQMLKSGVIDEVFYLEKKYTRKPKPLKAIGIKESLEYLDGKISLSKLPEKITIATAKLAKRQKTFNKSQFENVTRGDAKTLLKEIRSYLQSD